METMSTCGMLLLCYHSTQGLRFSVTQISNLSKFSICKIWWNLVFYDTQEVKSDDQIVPSDIIYTKYMCSVIEKYIILLTYSKIIIIYIWPLTLWQINIVHQCADYLAFSVAFQKDYSLHLYWVYCWAKNTDLGSQMCGTKYADLTRIMHLFLTLTVEDLYVLEYSLPLFYALRFCKWCGRYFQGHHLATLTVSLNKRPDSSQNHAEFGAQHWMLLSQRKTSGTSSSLFIYRLCTVRIKYCQTDTKYFYGSSMHRIWSNSNAIKEKTLEKVIFFNIFLLLEE